MDKKTKIIGLLAFILMASIFIFDLVFAIISINEISQVDPISSRVMLSEVIMYFFIDTLLIVNSIVGIVYIFKPRDKYSAMRRMVDELGGYALLSAFSIISISVITMLYAKSEGLEYHIPVLVYISLALLIPASVLGIICSTKRIMIRSRIKCYLSIIMCGLILVVNVISLFGVTLITDFIFLFGLMASIILSGIYLFLLRPTYSAIQVENIHQEIVDNPIKDNQIEENKEE